ncbi:hypothetical protein ALTER154_40169 [Alteromonas sp. 154]|nr:hypothetical protein ALTER154_40169 [Alteromonas sp. 154]
MIQGERICRSVLINSKKSVRGEGKSCEVGNADATSTIRIEILTNENVL